MLQGDVISSRTLGADLRAMRKSRGLTLEELSRRLGKSTGWLSQVERAISQPSDADLRALSEALSAPLSMLLAGAGTNDETGFVVRAAARRRLDRGIEGLEEELLSPDLTDDFEVVYSTFAPGSRRQDPTQRPTQELGILISGTLELTIGERAFTVRTGDSFRLRGESFTWANPHEVPAIAIWVIAPPVY